RFHDTNTANPTNTSTQAAVYFTSADATSSAPNIVQNNLIYNFNGAGIIYALYNTGSNYAQYYHNSISLNETASTSTTATYGFYQTTAATDIDFKNNIISITRGGTGVKSGLYFNTTGSTITSDYNVIWVNGVSGANNIGNIAAA